MGHIQFPISSPLQLCLYIAPLTRYYHSFPKTPCLIQIHWLPVRYRIQYKLCTLMHNIRSGRAPRYLSDIVQPTSARTTCSGLRSSSTEITSYVTHLGCAQRLENERFPFPVQSFRAYPADLYLYAASIGQC